MRRGLAILSAVALFGWMAAAGGLFVVENPGALGPAVEPLARRLVEDRGPSGSLRERLVRALRLTPAWSRVPPEQRPPEGPLRSIEQIRASLTRPGRSFQGFPVAIPAALALSAWLALVFIGTGLWVLRFLNMRIRSPLESAAVAGALGMGLWGLLTLAIGALGLLYAAVLVGLLAAATAASVPVWREWTASVAQSRPRLPRGAPAEAGTTSENEPAEAGTTNFIGWIAAVLSCAAIVLAAVYTLTPEIQSDALRYHLAAPQAYVREHRVFYIPSNAFTNFPFLLEMLFTLAFAIAGDLAAKMIHFECYVLTGLFVALLARREAAGSRLPYGILAALAFWTTPTALLVGAWGFIDLGTALFFVATIYALLQWHGASGPPSRSGLCVEDGPPLQSGYCGSGPQSGWRLLSGLFLGLLLGTKYTMLAMLVVVPIALLPSLRGAALWRLRGTKQSNLGLVELPSFAPNGRWDIRYWIRSSAFVIAAALLAASPWFIKNILFTGNPVYPLASGIFDDGFRGRQAPILGPFPGGSEWTQRNARFYFAKSSLKGYHPRYDRSLAATFKHILATPYEATLHWRLRVEPKPDGSYAIVHPGYEDHFLGPLYLLFLPLVLIALLKGKARPGKLIAGLSDPSLPVGLLHRTTRESFIESGADDRLCSSPTGREELLSKCPFRLIVLFTIAYFGLWYFTYQSNRLLIPALAAMCVLIAGSLAIAERFAPRLAYAAAVVLLAVALYNLEWSAEWIVREAPGKPSAAAYALGFQTRDRYIQQAFPVYAAYRLMPAYVPKGDKVLFVGEYRTLHAPVRAVANDWFDTPIIQQYLARTRGAQGFFDLLRQNEIRWILLNESELREYLAFFKSWFTEEQYARFEALFYGGRKNGVESRTGPTPDARLRQTFGQSGLFLFEVVQERTKGTKN
jgi:hypothetical protein